MRTERGAAPGSWSLGLLVLLACAAAGSWWWRARTLATPAADPAQESWNRVKDAYPLPRDPETAPQLTPEIAAGIVAANPFSPERRAVPPTVEEGEGVRQGGGTVEPAAPIFVYKGRVRMGPRERAILEDTAVRKTYFLEAGQEVRGFKVLDIAESQVVLSDAQTNEAVVVPLKAAASRP